MAALNLELLSSINKVRSCSQVVKMNSLKKDVKYRILSLDRVKTKFEHDAILLTLKNSDNPEEKLAVDGNPKVFISKEYLKVFSDEFNSAYNENGGFLNDDSDDYDDFENETRKTFNVFSSKSLYVINRGPCPDYPQKILYDIISAEI